MFAPVYLLFLYISPINSIDCFTAYAVRNDVYKSLTLPRHCERSEAIQYNFYPFMYNWGFYANFAV